jgi:hypothetical protein
VCLFANSFQHIVKIHENSFKMEAQTTTNLSKMCPWGTRDVQNGARTLTF